MPKAEMIFLTRRATFSASHYYWNEAWPAEKNAQVFGRWPAIPTR